MKNLCIVYNYGYAADYQDITIGNTLSREAAADIAYHHWIHLSYHDQKRIGSTYTVQVYRVPDQLEDVNAEQLDHMTADEIESEMALDGLLDDDDLLIDSFEIDASAL